MEQESKRSREVHAARQVLMNELGLTREAVREEMKAIVRETMERQVGQMNFESILKEIIADRLSRAKGGWSANHIQNIIEAKVQGIVNTAIREKLKFNIDISGNFTEKDLEKK